MTASPPPDAARFSPRPGVIATDLQSEMVLLDPETQQMFRLNQTGRAIWLSLGAQDVAGLTGTLVETFAVSAEQAGRDLRLLLGELVSAGLIAPRS